MIALGHTSVGVIVGVTAYKFLGQGNLATGLIIAGSAGMISHYLMDAIPHGHFFMVKNYKKSILPIIIFDLSLPIIFFLWTIYSNNGFGVKFLYVLFAIGGAQLPDVIAGLIYIKIIKDKGLLSIEDNLHNALHWRGKNSQVLLLGWLDIWQILVILIALLLVIFNTSSTSPSF